MTDSTLAPGHAGVPTVPPSETQDGFGQFGVSLTKYHVGDFLGFVGLLISVLTLFAAQSARRAAKAALVKRDAIELASLFADLASHCRAVRTILALDDWTRLSEAVDSAVGISNRLESSTRDGDEIEMLQSASKTLRQLQRATSGIKDATKHRKLRRTHDLPLIDVLDQIEKAHTKRLKDDDIS